MSGAGAGNLIWTGGLNDPFVLGGSVGLYDTTLRDGEQTVGVVLDPEQKLEIAKLLDDLGIDRIEAGFPRVSQDDWDAVQLIAAAGLRAQVWGFSPSRLSSSTTCRCSRPAVRKWPILPPFAGGCCCMPPSELPPLYWDRCSFRPPSAAGTCNYTAASARPMSRR